MKITSLENFQKFVGSFPVGEKWIFRGQSDSSWKLRPQAGRLKYSVKTKSSSQNGDSGDLDRFEAWRQSAKAVFHKLPRNDFECLAFAQHYGLVTRLLDWTKDPLVALFFAVNNSGAKNSADGIVFAHKPNYLIRHRKVKFTSPELAWHYSVLEPEVLNPRVFAQKGLFTYHNDPWADLKQVMSSDVLRNVVISCSVKNRIREQLREAGYSKAKMFPDIETISQKVNRETRFMAKKLQRLEEARFGIQWNVDE